MTGRRRLGWLGFAVAIALAVAIPVYAAGPPPSASPSGHPKPDTSPKPGKGNRAAKTPEVAITIDGTVQEGKDGQGRPSYSLTANGTTWELAAGPPWNWSDKTPNPLKAYAGKSVKVTGTTQQGSSELDVETVNGTAIRAPGKPPWAGGPWRVGSTRPGWKPWMAGGKPGNGGGNGNGKALAPGRQKDKSKAGDDNEPAESGEPADSPGS
jgi:hypothetical protein